MTKQINKIKKNAYYQNDIYNIKNKLFNLLKKHFFLQFSLFQNSIVWVIFDFGLKKSQITRVVQKMVKIINLPYYLSHFIKKIHFLTLTFFLGPLTWNRLKQWGDYFDFFGKKPTFYIRPDGFENGLIYQTVI